jgi:GNAT superfamily N-acetyltransferase
MELEDLFVDPDWMRQGVGRELIRERSMITTSRASWSASSRYWVVSRTSVPCTVTCFYHYAEQEGVIAVSPAAHVRRPHLGDGPFAAG